MDPARRRPWRSGPAWAGLAKLGSSVPPRRGFAALRLVLLHRLDAGVLDHLAPHWQFVFHDLKKLRRRIADQLQAETFELLADVGLRHHLGRLGMELVDDR